MTTRYFKVLHKSGAFIDNVYYPPADQVSDVMDAVVAMEGIAPGKEPQWGVEVDERGNEIAAVPAGALDKMSDALASKLAAGAGAAPLKDVEDPGDGASGQVGKDADARKAAIVETLELLDHADDAHWTEQGLPNVKVVAETSGLEVTRKEVTEAAPDFKRVKPA